MLRSKTFAKKTKKGNVVKVVKEHYLRTDIGTGVGTVLDPNAQCYIIPDTNVCLHQIDLLENPQISNAIILQTVMEECKSQNASIYNRLRTLTTNEKKRFYVFSNEHHAECYVERNPNETMNDRNDRAIRVAALWYQRKLAEGIPIFLITNDRANLEKALQMEVVAKTVQDYVREMRENPELLDLLKSTDDTPSDTAAAGGKMSKKKQLFEEHKPLSEIMKGIGAVPQKYFQGSILVNRNNPNEATVEITGFPESNIVLLKGWENINRAVNNDIVAVEILPREKWGGESSVIIEESSKNANEEAASNLTKNTSDKGTVVRPTGKVVGIIKRNWKAYCGSLDEDTEVGTGNHPVYFIAVDKRIPKIRIRTRQVNELMTKRITVVIDKWEVNSRYPEGHYVSTLGDIGDIETESEVILLEHDIPHYQFPETVLKCLPPNDWYITEEEIKKRRDLRSLTICSVDPPGCKDIDDALHYRKLPNGNCEIGVHIADVTHFVKEGTALDDEAAKRSTSVYLVDRRIDMLPKLLTEKLCSLVSNADRLTFSVVWELTPQAEIVKEDFFKAVINSKASLTYQQAQAMIDDPSQKTDIAKGLRGLLNISKILKQKRTDAGALSLASPAVKFDLDTETMNPTDVSMYQLRDTNSMVEEFMLLANIAVAKRILKDFPTTACLRRHPSPVPFKSESLLKSLKTLGKSLNMTSSKALAASLDKLEFADRPYLNTLIRILTTRCLEQAVYFGAGEVPKDEFHHYGLATPIYTHFTSPIRRYADVIVHRQLACCLGIDALTPNLTEPTKMKMLTAEMNTRHKMAQYAQRSSVELYTLVYFKELVAEENAFIHKVKQNAVIVFVPRYGIEGIVYVSEVEASASEQNPFTYDAENELLTLKKNPGTKLKVFDEVKVRIYVVTSKNYRRKLTIDIISPDIPLTHNNKPTGKLVSSIPKSTSPSTSESAEEMNALENEKNSKNETNDKKRKRETTSNASSTTTKQAKKQKK